jgi:hypothetical protein
VAHVEVTMTNHRGETMAQGTAALRMPTETQPKPVC